MEKNEFEVFLPLWNILNFADLVKAWRDINVLLWDRFHPNSDVTVPNLRDRLSDSMLDTLKIHSEVVAEPLSENQLSLKNNTIINVRNNFYVEIKPHASIFLIFFNIFRSNLAPKVNTCDTILQQISAVLRLEIPKSDSLEPSEQSGDS